MNRVRQLVHADKAYRMGYTGKNIRVVALDTGVYLHPDIRGNVKLFLDFIAGKTICYDDNGHGTHVAGILCGNGRLKGIAPQSQLIMLKVLEKDGGGKTKNVIRGLEWVIQHHREQRIRILNFSVGFLPGAHSEEQRKILEMLEQLWDEGVTVVTAAGNNGPKEGTVTAPGISRKVITVGASDDGMKSAFFQSGYSGKGPTECCIIKPEIYAPGTNIVSLDNKGSLYVKKSGTSMATPVVSAALALALEKNPYLRPEELKLKLYQSAKRERSLQKGWGLLQVDKLLDLV